jgi:hypothetical protein
MMTDFALLFVSKCVTYYEQLLCLLKRLLTQKYAKDVVNESLEESLMCLTNVIINNVDAPPTVDTVCYNHGVPYSLIN